MALSTRYVLKESFSSLKRNLLMTFAAILAVAVSLSLVGSSLLIKQGVTDATLQWRGGVQLSIFINANATPSQTSAIVHKLSTMSQVKKFSYTNQKQAYKDFKLMFAGQPALVKSVTPTDLPPSFRVVPKKAQFVNQIGNSFQNMAGVTQVVYAKKVVATLLKVTKVLQILILGVAVVLLFSAIILILNTIRVAIFARRKEVAVMKLVGATNWFIRLPFMLEGFIEGLLGASIAFGIIVLAEDLLTRAVNFYHLQLLDAMVVPKGDVIGTGIFVFVIGIVLGSLGSALAVRKFLDV